MCREKKKIDKGKAKKWFVKGVKWKRGLGGRSEWYLRGHKNFYWKGSVGCSVDGVKWGRG